MKNLTLDQVIAIAAFLGNEMTDEQASRLMDDAKQNLSIAEMEILHGELSGPLYYEISMYDAEMGGLSRY